MHENGQGRVLIVDDEHSAIKVLSAILTRDGYSVSQAVRAMDALRMIPRLNPDLIISDMKMNGMDGMALFENLRTGNSQIPFIFLTAYGSVESAVSAMAAGAYHYFVKPPDYSKLREVIGRAMAERRAAIELQSAERSLDETDAPVIHGTSPAIVDLLQIIDEVKDSASNVLITGETGTGKELIVKMLHYKSCRRNMPLITVNCAAIPPELMESEFFGSEKGSYTGAAARRIGKFEEAAGGAILLDEIGELPLPLQAKLLRVLQEKEIERIGSNKKIKVDFRLLASTNRDLAVSVKKGTFREDLYYRVNVIHLTVPPLRERTEDIPVLVREFAREFCAREKKRLSVPDEVIQMLQAYHWPGNIRQLKNSIERAVVLARGDRITRKQFEQDLQEPKESIPAGAKRLKSLRDMEIEAIKYSLKVFNGNKSKTAERLGISRKALYKRLNESDGGR